MRQFSESQFIPLRPDYLANAIVAVFNQLGWSYRMPSSYQFSANTGFNFFSFGETITVEIYSDSMIKVESKCNSPIQLVDWGKNKQNVQVFFAKLRMAANVG